MSWGTKRKLIYLSIFFFVVFVLVGIPAFAILYKPPTCFDGKQNQKEDGVDCAGPCVKLCKPLELLPVIIWQQAFEVIPGTYSAVAYIENPNLNAESKNVPYKFTLYDSKNVVLAVREGRTYIPPGRNFAVFESNIVTLSSEPARTEFEFGSDYTWHLAQKKPDLKINNLSATNVDVTPMVSADIENPTLANLGRLSATAIVYDSEGNAFAASRTFIDYLDRELSAHVVFTWPLPFEKPVARIEIIPILMQ